MKIITQKKIKKINRTKISVASKIELGFHGENTNR